MPTEEEILETAYSKLRPTKPTDDEDAKLEAAYRSLSQPQQVVTPGSPDLFDKSGQPGYERPAPPGPKGAQFAIQPFLRFGTGAAGAIGELVASLGNTVSRVSSPIAMAAGNAGDVPLKFSAADFRHQAENLGVLTETNFLGRTAELLGEGVVNIGALVAGSGALQAAGFSAKVANAVAITGSTLLAHQQQAAQAGHPVSAADLALSIGYTAAAIPLGHVGGKLLGKAVQTAIRRPLGKRMLEAINNSAMATAFEAQNIAKQVPDWKERWLASALSFDLVATHEAMFPGETRPRTAGAAKQSWDALDKLTKERELGTSNQPPPDVARAEARGEPTPGEMAVRLSRARSYVENSQSRIVEDQAEGGRVSAFDLMAMFDIPAEDARRIAQRRLTGAEKQEALDRRKNEIAIEDARNRGGEHLAMETASRLGELTDGQEAAWKKQRAALPKQVRTLLEDSFQSPDEVIKRISSTSPEFEADVMGRQGPSRLVDEAGREIPTREEVRAKTVGAGGGVEVPSAEASERLQASREKFVPENPTIQQVPPRRRGEEIAGQAGMPAGGTVVEPGPAVVKKKSSTTEIPILGQKPQPSPVLGRGGQVLPTEAEARAAMVGAGPGLDVPDARAGARLEAARKKAEQRKAPLIQRAGARRSGEGIAAEAGLPAGGRIIERGDITAPEPAREMHPEAAAATAEIAREPLAVEKPEPQTQSPIELASDVGEKGPEAPASETPKEPITNTVAPKPGEVTGAVKKKAEKNARLKKMYEIANQVYDETGDNEAAGEALFAERLKKAGFTEAEFQGRSLYEAAKEETAQGLGLNRDERTALIEYFDYELKGGASTETGMEHVTGLGAGEKMNYSNKGTEQEQVGAWIESKKYQIASRPGAVEGVQWIAKNRPNQPALQRAAAAVQKAYDEIKARGHLTDDQIRLMAVGGLTLGSYAIGQSQKDDETREQWQQFAAVPAIFLLGRGRKLSPSARAEFEATRERGEKRDAERSEHDRKIRERVEKALAKTDDLIYTAKPGPVKTKEIAKDMMDLMPESTASPQSTSLQHTKEQMGRSATGSLRKYYGPAGDRLGRLAQDAERTGRMYEERLRDEHNRMNTGPYGDPPNKPMKESEQKLLGQYMNWTRDPSLPKPDMEAIKKGSNKLRRELYVALHGLYGEKILEDLSPAERATVIENTRFYDEAYARRLKEEQDAGIDVQPLYTHNGRYRPHIHEDYVFDPPVSMKNSRNPKTRAEYYERLAVAAQHQEAIAKDSGVPLHDVRDALRGEQEQGGPWARRTLDKVLTKKVTSIDYHRVFSSPIGIKWSPSAQYLRYIENAVPRVEVARRFGPDGQVADTILKLLEKDGFDRAGATELYDYATGQHPKYLSGFESWYGRGLGHVSSFVRMGALGRFVQPQFIQLLAPGMSVGRNPAESIKLLWQQKLNAIGGAIEMSADLPLSVKKKLGKEIPARIATNAGVGLKATYLQEQAHVKSPFARLTTMLLKAQGGTIMDRAARVQGAVVGDAWFKLVREMQLAAVRSGDQKKLDESRQYLGELFRDEPVLLEMSKRTDLTQHQEDYLGSVAAQNLSDRWNHHIAPSTMPLMYSHPIGRHFYTLGTFQYRQTATFHRLMEDARQYPATRLRMAAMGGLLTGAGMLLLYTRRLGQPGPVKDDDPFWLDVVNGAAFSWFAPIWVNLFNSIFHNPVRSAVGPTHAFVWDVGETMHRSVEQQSLTPFEKLVIKKGIPQHPIPGLPQPRDMILEEVDSKKKRRR